MENFDLIQKNIKRLLNKDKLSEAEKFIKSNLFSIKEKEKTNILNNYLAQIYYSKKQFRISLEYYNQLTLEKYPLQIEDYIRVININILLKNLEKAKYYFDFLINYSCEESIYEKVILEVALFAIENNEKNLAFEYINLINPQTLNDELLEKYYRYLYLYHKINNNYKESLKYKKKSFKLKNILMESDAKNKLVKLNLDYDLESKLKEKELHRLENIELKSINLSKDKFFSIVAHDLRAPFSSILSFISLLKKHHKNYTKEEMLKMINELEKIVKNSYSLLENLLEWSRFQTGILKYKPEIFSIKQIVNNILKTMLPIAKHKDITLISKIRKDIYVFADKFMITTVLRNLISNAIKFTPQKGKIEISQKRINNKLKILVKDNGVGIPNDKINKLFKLEESFTTIGTNNEKGTGLGLILCKEFIDKNHGKISAKSILNKGSVFSITIPLRENDGR